MIGTSRTLHLVFISTNILILYITLPGFFENLAFEAKLDADKSVMIKNSIHARKSFVKRASTLRYESRRKHSSRGELLCYAIPTYICV